MAGPENGEMRFSEDGILISYDRNGNELISPTAEEQYYINPLTLRERSAPNSKTGEEKKEKKGSGNVHAGHRERIRERFVKEGLDGFSDYEVLELVLFYANARGDTNVTAHELMDQFGSLKTVMEARPEMLMQVNGVGEAAATLLSFVSQLNRRYQSEIGRGMKQIASRQTAEMYCKSLVMGCRTERFHVICLSASCRILGQRRISEGSLSEVNAYPRLVAETALNYNAHSVILCHNHPGGTEMPSQDDIKTTEHLQKILGGLGITLLDHVIVSGDRSYSMVQHGDMVYRNR